MSDMTKPIDDVQSRNQFNSWRPHRRPGSIRRTSSLQSLWTVGSERSFTMVGQARDRFTSRDGETRIVANDDLRAEFDIDRRIVSLVGNRRQDRLQGFVGLNPGGEMRQAMAVDLADEERDATGLHRLLDDLAGAAFMSFSAWFSWHGGVAAYARAVQIPEPDRRKVEGVCISFAPGSPSMNAEGRAMPEEAAQPVGPYPAVFSDAEGFHELVRHDGPSSARLRCTDVWREDGKIIVDAWFQDSSALPGIPDQRQVYHEYGLHARIDPDTHVLEAIEVQPYVLPHLTCYAAPATAEKMLGNPVGELRTLVPVQLRRTAGCTHLNDMLRSLHDVGALADKIA